MFEGTFWDYLKFSGFLKANPRNPAAKLRRVSLFRSAQSVLLQAIDQMERRAGAWKAGCLEKSGSAHGASSCFWSY